MFKNYADEDTLVTNRNWKILSDDERLDAINQIKESDDYFKDISINRGLADGHVFVTLNENFGVAQRGTLLLDFEEELKNTLDKGLTVWCDPLGDRNSLRKLRGIEIKT